MKNFLFISIFFISFLCMAACGNRYEELYIENIKLHDFKQSNIVLNEKVKEDNAFSSYIVSYYSNGLRQYALMQEPKGNKEKYPVVIVNHGYIPPHKYSTINSYKLVTSYFAKNGFLVLKPDYRGHDNSENGDSSRLNRLYYTIDVLNLMHALPSLDKADLDNIFVYGHSMGGGVTLAVLETYDNVRAASLWAPVMKEFPESNLFFIRKRDMESAEKLKRAWDKIFSKDDYHKLSPINYISLIKAPVILHHGTHDSSVPYSWSEELAGKFKEHDINFRFYTYEDDHNFAWKYFYVVLKRDVEFFKKFIK